MKILSIIPCKLDSKRLPKKNIQKIAGKTLIEHSIDLAKQSKYNPRIVLSSESNIVKDIADKNNVDFSLREVSMCGDTEVVDVYVQLLKKIGETFDLVVCLQPDHPDREFDFDYYVDYMLENNYDDLITIEPTFKRSGSVRIFKYNHLISGNVSKRIGCLKDDATDIHYKNDLQKAEISFHLKRENLTEV